VLNDDDKVTFAVARSRTPFLVGALLLALAATGGIFAFGFTNANVTLSATATTDFVSVTTNTTLPSWTVWGLFKGDVLSNHDLFYVKKAAGWTGDLVITVSLGNVGELAQTYRACGLELFLCDSGDPTHAELPLGLVNDQKVLLSLDYPSVNMYTTSASANITVRIKSGYYIGSHFPTGPSGSASPQIFCDVTQSDF
jgi:hypothetical protein